MPTSHFAHVTALRLESERSLAAWATTLMLVPGVLFAYVDVSIEHDRQIVFILHSLRATLLVLWVLGLVLIRRATSREGLGRALFLLALAIVAFITANAILRPTDNWMPVRTMVLISIGTFVVYPYPFRRQLVAWAALMLAFAGLVQWRWVAMPRHERFASTLNLLMAGALGMLVARNRARLDRDLDESLERERAAITAREQAVDDLRTLQGIIPICAYCHQVRSEAGAWGQLDHYVRERTDADFSHGICPNCLAEHFPQEAEEAPAAMRPAAPPTPGT